MQTQNLKSSDPSGAAQDREREFAFNDRDFQRIRKMIYQHAGISLSPKKSDMVYSRVARRVRATGLQSFDAYLSKLDRGDTAEWQAFTNALTTNLTAFFREAHHFPILAEHVSKLSHRPIQIWCAAASTGEEPYSLAITLAEQFGTLAPPATIVASDVDTTVLEAAESGEYALERVAKLERDRLQNYFLCGSGPQEGRVKVRPELRKLIEFRQINLLDADWKLDGLFDAIFCRNVMIYFDKPTQARILEKFAPLLRPNGLLFAGHSESLFHVSHLFRPRGKTVYALAEAGTQRRVA